jgi:hypothetical protein
LYREILPQTNYQLFSPNDIAVATDLKTILPIDARVLTLQETNNVVSTLTGRYVLSGYSGWLWTYGINSGPEENARTDILAGNTDSSQLIAQYGLTDLVLNDDEIAADGIPYAWLVQTYPEIYNQKGWHVFVLASKS